MPLYTKFSTTRIGIEVACAYCDRDLEPHALLYLQETDTIMKESKLGVDYTIMCEPCHRKIRNQCLIWEIPFEDNAERMSARAGTATIREDS